MILPHTYAATLGLMILSLLCWALWANTYKMAGKWRFELYYFDFALGLLACSALCALTLGNLGYDGFTFMDDVMHAGKRQWLSAFTGGAVFTIGNMFLLSAVSVAGMAVAFPVGLGLALIVWSLASHVAEPAGNAAFLFSGCGIVFGSIIAAALSYRALGGLRHEEMAKAGLAKSTRKSAPIKGVVLALVAGLPLGLFGFLVDNATQTEVGLGPYALAVFFALGAFFTAFAADIFFMNLPVEGEPVELLEYFKGGFRRHFLGFAGGVIVGAGAVASFVAANAGAPGMGSFSDATLNVAPAVRFALSQGAPLIAALSGIVFWREFKGADARVKALGGVMLLLFACGLTLASLAQTSPAN